LYNKGEYNVLIARGRYGQFAVLVLLTIFSTTNWNYLPNFTQINTQYLKRFRVYIITFDTAKVEVLNGFDSL